MYTHLSQLTVKPILSYKNFPFIIIFQNTKKWDYLMNFRFKIENILKYLTWSIVGIHMSRTKVFPKLTCDT